MNSLHKKLCLTIGLVLASHICSADNTGSRTITSIGCHLNNSACYVYIDGENVGPNSCVSNSIRWDKDSTVGGKETLSLLMAAFASEKKVNFNIADSCYGNYPTFNWISVYQ